MKRISRFIQFVANVFDAYLRLSSRWHLVLTLLPPLCVFLFLVFLHVDIPYQDQWDSEWPRIQNTITGTLTLRDLWTQNNEHRPLFPSVIWIPLALLTHWNTFAEVLAGLLLACATFTLWVRQARRTMCELGLPHISAVFPLLSLVFFSLNQWENWLFGFCIQVFMHIFAVTLGIVLLLRPSRSAWHLAGAMLCGLVATYTMLNGLLFWPLGLAILILGMRERVRPFREVEVILWIVCASLIAGSYFYQYHTVASHPSMLAALRDPAGFVLYVLTLLGASMLTYYVAAGVGLLGLGIFFYLLRLMHALTGFRPFNFFLSLAAYSLLSVLIVGIGRVGFGWKQALSPRYVTLVIGFWLALIFCLYCFALLPQAHILGRYADRTRSLFKACLAGLTVLAIMCCVGGVYLGYTIRYQPIAEARQAILAGQADDAMLKRLHPDPALVRKQLALLRQYHFSLFRDVQP